MKINFIDQNGKYFKDFEYSKALNMANDLNLDLVKFTVNNSFLYKLTKLSTSKFSPRKTNKLKSVTLKTQIFSNDYYASLNKIKKMILKGFNVKIILKQIGREITKVNILNNFSNRVVKDVSLFSNILKKTLKFPGHFVLIIEKSNNVSKD